MTTITLGTTTITTRINGSVVKNFGSSANLPFSFSDSYTASLVNGVGVSQADMPVVIRDATSTSLSIITGSVTDIDLTAVTGPYGPVNFASVRAIVFANLSQTAGEDIVWGGATNPFLGPMGGTGPTFTFSAGLGGSFTPWICPTSSGWAVSGSAKNIRLRSATGTPSYALYILGVTV